MKKISLLLILCFVSGLIFFTGCDSPEETVEKEPVPQEQDNTDFIDMNGPTEPPSSVGPTAPPPSE